METSRATDGPRTTHKDGALAMIPLTRLSGSVFVLNSDLVERIDATPDTVITLMDGKKYVVAESLSTVTATIRRYRAEIIALSSVVQVGDPLDGIEGAEPAVPRPTLSLVEERHAAATSAAASHLSQEAPR